MFPPYLYTILNSVYIFAANEDNMIAEINFKKQSIVYSLRLLVFYVIRSALAERYLKWTSGDNAFIFVDRSAKAERISKEYRQKLDNINKDQVWQLTSNGKVKPPVSITRASFAQIFSLKRTTVYGNPMCSKQHKA